MHVIIVSQFIQINSPICTWNYPWIVHDILDNIKLYLLTYFN